MIYSVECKSLIQMSYPNFLHISSFIIQADKPQVSPQTAIKNSKMKNRQENEKENRKES